MSTAVIRVVNSDEAAGVNEANQQNEVMREKLDKK